MTRRVVIEKEEEMEDMALEILLQMPVTSLGVLKCVSKKWDAFISYDSYFRKNYRDMRGSSLVMGIFSHNRYFNGLSFDVPEIRFVSTSGQGRMLLDRSEDAFRKAFNLPAIGIITDQLNLIASSNGFLLFSRSDDSGYTCFVCNPITMKWYFLPTCDKTTYVFLVHFICQGEKNPRYKVFRALRSRRTLVSPTLKIEMFDSDHKKFEWKEFNATCSTSFRLNEFKSSGVVSEDGVVYLVVVTQNHKHAIVVFDHRKEDPSQLEMIALPEEAKPDDTRWYSGTYNHHLGQNNGSMVYVLSNGQHIKMWVMDEHTSRDWNLTHIVATVEMTIGNPGIIEESIKYLHIEAFHPLDPLCLLVVVKVKDGRSSDSPDLIEGFKGKLVWYNLQSGRMELVEANKDYRSMTQFFFVPYMCPSWAPSSLLFK